MRWTVLYDRDCGFCRWSLAQLLALDRRRRLRPVALGTPEADALLADLTPEQRAASWHLVSPDGRRWSAGAAAPPLLRLLPGGRLPAAVACAGPGHDRARLPLGRRSPLHVQPADPGSGQAPRRRADRAALRRCEQRRLVRRQVVVERLRLLGVLVDLVVACSSPQQLAPDHVPVFVDALARGRVARSRGRGRRRSCSTGIPRPPPRPGRSGPRRARSRSSQRRCSSLPRNSPDHEFSPGNTKLTSSALQPQRRARCRRRACAPSSYETSCFASQESICASY